jgi:signal peptide peptidase SppA
MRSFFTALFALIGITVGLIPLFFLAGALNAPKDGLRSQLTATLLPNAEGLRAPIDFNTPTILQIDIHGVIGNKKLNAKTIHEQLLESQEPPFAENNVKAILLSINSPGGTVVDSDIIYRALKNYKEKYNTPIYAYVDGICASGGVYVASAADKVYASNASLVGSVGVLLQFMNFSDMLEKIGVYSHTLTAGKGKDAMSPLRPWTEDEDKQFRKLTDHFYKQFVDIVVAARPELDKDILVNEMGAQVFSGEEATRFGLIDGSNYERSDVIEELIAAANIEGEYQVVTLQEKKWITDFFESKSPLITGKISHDFNLPSLSLQESSHPFLYLYQPCTTQ